MKYKIGEKVMYKGIERKIVDFVKGHNDVLYTLNGRKDKFAFENDLSPIPPKSFETLKVGEPVWTESGEKRTVTKVYNVYVLNSIYDRSPIELREYGYSLSPPEKMVPLNKVLEKLEELAE